jgi:hypothetical protein
MEMTRRKLLSSAVIGGGAVGLAACTTAQISTFETSWTAFVDQVQGLVNNAAGYIPIVESIAATMASLFGPTWTSAVALGTAVLNQVVAALTSVVANLAPPAVASLRSRLRRSSLRLPVIIGVLPPTTYMPNGVVVHGYH